MLYEQEFIPYTLAFMKYLLVLFAMIGSAIVVFLPAYSQTLDASPKSMVFGFNAPSNTAIDYLGNLYVVDNGNNRIQVFDSSGSFLSKFGTYGSGIGEFSSPWSIAIDSNGKIHVTDSENHRVQVFGPSGEYETQFSSWGYGSAELQDPRGIEIDAHGNIYVTDVVNRSIKVFKEMELSPEDKLDLWDKSFSKLISPLKQFKSGISTDKIYCKEGLALVEKHDKKPACVKTDSIPKLLERNWIILVHETKFSEQSGEPSDEYGILGPLGGEHSHAAVLVKIFGNEIDFSLPAYQNRTPWIHFEGGDGFTLHKHASGVRLGHFFDSLGMTYDSRFCYEVPDGRGFCTNDDYSLRFYFNDLESGGYLKDIEIQDGDRILITYGAKSPQDIEEQLAELNNRKIVHEFSPSFQIQK